MTFNHIIELVLAGVLIYSMMAIFTLMIASPYLKEAYEEDLEKEPQVWKDVPYSDYSFVFSLFWFLFWFELILTLFKKMGKGHGQDEG